MNDCQVKQISTAEFDKSDLDRDEVIRRDAYEKGKTAGLTLGWNLRRLAELTGQSLDESLNLLERIK